MMELSEVKWPIVYEKPLYYRKNYDDQSRSLILDTHKMIVNENDDILNVVSKNYTTIQHGDFVGDVIEMIPNEFGIQKPKLWISDDHARMSLDITFPDIVVDIGKNDPISPTLELKNSHDGHWAVDLMLGAFRFRCSNGLVIGKQIFHQGKKHIGERIYFPSLKEDFKRSMDDFFIQTKVWDSWQDRITTYNDYERVMIACQFGKKAMAEIEEEVEVSSNKMIHDIQLKTLSYWFFYNILMQYVSHKVESRIRKAEFQARMRKVF